MHEKVRVDKWLWSTRIFKSRTQATNACNLAKVKVDGVQVKARKNIGLGSIVTVRKNQVQYTYEILKLIEKRVGAALAQECFIDQTSKEELEKLKSKRLPSVFYNPGNDRPKGSGRPTKKDRRDIDGLMES